MVDKSDPFIRRVRLDMAEVYRKIRTDSPAAARLLFRRSKWCDARLHEFLLGSGPNPLTDWPEAS